MHYTQIRAGVGEGVGRRHRRQFVGHGRQVLLTRAYYYRQALHTVREVQAKQAAGQGWHPMPGTATSRDRYEADTLNVESAVMDGQMQSGVAVRQLQR